MQIGKHGEELAKNFLQKNGIEIVNMNYRTPYGEIDIVGKGRDQLIFFEIKTRTSQRFGDPEESITQKKKDALINSCLQYLQEHDLFDCSWRIDVIAILKSKDHIQYNWIENAITCE